jgi:lipoate-protein ligase B
MKAIKNYINTIDLGQKPFKEVWELQKKYQKERIDGKIDDILILVEHDPVYTFGKNANDNHLLQSRDKSINTFKIERGGDITFHGPGQLVCYPILNLSSYKKSVTWYMRTLEEVIINFLALYDISAHRIDGLTGVWVGDEKIAAQGVRISRWVTMHGFSININLDLSFYDGIIPCGIFDRGVTSMEKILGQGQNIDIVKKDIISTFNQLFIKGES